MNLDLIELEKIMTHFVHSGVLFDRSNYRYGIYKKLLSELYPALNDYKKKTIFDELIKLGYINKIPCNRSFKYQFNSFSYFPAMFDKKDIGVVIFE